MQARRYGVDAVPDGATALRPAAARQPDVLMRDAGADGHLTKPFSVD